MRIYSFILSILLIIACKDAKNDPAKKDKPVKEIGHHKPSSGFIDTLTINSSAAVFFKPDSTQWQQLKLVNDTMVYNSFEHDCFFQMRNARNVLKEHYNKINIIEAVKVRYLLFKQSSGSSQLIDLDAVNDPCGIFLFNTQKAAQLADMMNIDTELGFYFKQ